LYVRVRVSGRAELSERSVFCDVNCEKTIPDPGLTVAQSLVFSAFHQIDDRVAVMGNAGWQNWSKFGVPTIGINTNPEKRNRKPALAGHL
jgi:hypothetical protein